MKTSTRKGLLGTKLGMTQVWDDNARVVPVTVIEAGPCVVTQVRTPDTDGYSGLSAGAGFKTSSYGIDYAFVPFGALGNTHRFSVTFYWDKGAPKTPRQDKKKTKAQPARKTAIQPASTTSYDGYTVPQPASPITTRQRKYIPATIKTP